MNLGNSDAFMSFGVSNSVV